jgi:hypothetical protein
LSISHAPSNVVGFIRTHLLPSVATRFTQNPFLKIRVSEKLAFMPIEDPEIIREYFKEKTSPVGV